MAWNTDVPRLCHTDCDFGSSEEKAGRISFEDLTTMKWMMKQPMHQMKDQVADSRKMPSQLLYILEEKSDRKSLTMYNTRNSEGICVV